MEVEVKNEITHLNEAHMLVRKSTIEGVQRGLFIRQENYQIGADRTICSYQEKPDKEVDTSLTSDYLFEAKRSGKVFYYQAAKYDGQNIGCFINQGGRKEGLKQMRLVSDRETGHTSFQSGLVNQEFEKHCNVKYAQWGNELVVKDTSNLCLAQTRLTELFGNYDYKYWVKYVAQHYQELDHASELVHEANNKN